MKKPLTIANAVAPFGVVRPVCYALLALAFGLSSCGKKEEKGQEQKAAPAATVPEMKETPEPKSETPATPAPATKGKSETPAAPLPTPKADSSASKPKAGSPQDWARWERVAGNARSIGLTVRPSDNPRWMEVVVGSALSLNEARLVGKNVQRDLGVDDSVVRVFNEAGATLVEVNSNGVQ